MFRVLKMFLNGKVFFKIDQIFNTAMKFFWVKLLRVQKLIGIAQSATGKKLPNQKDYQNSYYSNDIL